MGLSSLSNEYQISFISHIFEERIEKVANKYNRFEKMRPHRLIKRVSFILLNNEHCHELSFAFCLNLNIQRTDQSAFERDIWEY